MKYLWIGLGWLALGLGIAGAFLPLLPTTPFLLLAAFSFSKGSQHLHDWLLQHRTLGPPIHNWQQYRAVSRQAKIWATASIVVLFCLSIVLQAPYWAILVQATILTGVTLFLWTRREPPTNDHHQPKDPVT